MSTPTILYFFSVVLTLVLNGFLGFLAWRKAPTPGGRPFTWLVFSECLLAFTDVISMISPTQAQALTWFDARFVFTPFIPVFWLVFALDYSGLIGRFSKKALVGLFAIPIVTQVICWTNPLFGLWIKHDVTFHRDGFLWMSNTASRIPAVWYYVHLAYSLILLVAGAGLILWYAWRLKSQYLWQAILLSVGALTVLIVSLIPSFNFFPGLAINPFVPGIGLSQAMIALAIFRFHLLTGSPEETESFSDLQARERQSLEFLILIFALFTTGLVTFGYFTYRQYKDQYKTELDEQLTAIASLKVSQLESWRSERMGDANIFFENPIFSAAVQNFLENPGGAGVASQLQAWLDAVRTSVGYERVFLLSATGVERLSSPATPQAVSSTLAQQAAVALVQGQITFVDFYRDTPSGPIHLALLVPIYTNGNGNQPLGVVVLSIDPSATLYPIIREWPAPSDTAETLLARRAGNDVLILNNLKFQPNAALNLRIPLEQTNTLPVKAVLGQNGIVEGVDYRDQPVIGYVCAIPNTPWFLAARLESAEVYAPLQTRLWQTVFFFGVLILAGGAGLFLIWRQRGMRYYRAQVKAAQRLTASEMRYRGLFEAIREGILILDAETGLVVDANQFLVNLLGLPRDGIAGKLLWELGFFKDIAVDKANFVELQQKGYFRHENLPLETARGERLTVEFVSNVFQVDHQRVIQCNIRDITERVRSDAIIQARLRLVEFADQHSLGELLQKALDEVCAIMDSPIGFYHFLEPDQRTFSLEAWSTRTLQEFCKAEGTGPHFDIEEAGVWADCVRQRRAVIHNDYATLPGRKGLPDGHAALARELVVPVFREDRIVAVLGVGNRPENYSQQDAELVTYFADVAWEISRRKRAELELKTYSEHLVEMVAERTRDLQQAQEKLIRNERLATLGQLAGSVGHELRNPLGVISNAIYYLKLVQPDASDAIKKYLDIIEKETRISDKIVTDLLDFTRIKSLERKPADLSSLIGQALQRCSISASVDVARKIPPGLPRVYADPQHVVQVLGNLVTNACQAMEDPPGTTGAAVVRKLSLSASLRDDMVAIEVKDTGAGIPPENMDKLFEPLFTTKAKGIGLGLAVSRRLVEANGGRIEVQSQVGQGSTFTVYLPVYKEEKNGTETSHPDR